MNRDLKILMVVSAIFGLGTGLYQLLFTLYLNDLNVSLSTMGAIFSVSGLISFFVTIVVGTQSDVWGRKIIYSVSILLGSLSRFLVPLFTGVGQLTIIKSIQDIAIRSRTAVHGAFVFEHESEGYAKLIARMQGINLTLNATGFLIAGTVLLYFGYRVSFFAVGLLMFAAFIIFQFVSEPDRPKPKKKSILDMYRFDISRQLKIICLYNLIYGIGFSISHTVFIFTMFFMNKFALSPVMLSLVLGVHHFSFGIPMLILSRLFDRQNLNYKKTAIIGNLFSGIPVVIAAFIPNLVPAYVIWLLHDIVGAAITMPALQTLTQSYSRGDSRGKDTNMTSASRNIGMMIGPLIGGYLADMNISLPFIVGGIIISIATLILLPLDRTSISLNTQVQAN